MLKWLERDHRDVSLSLPVTAGNGGLGNGGVDQRHVLVNLEKLDSTGLHLDDVSVDVDSTGEIYCLSRSVLLPRVALRHQPGVNPLFIDDDCDDCDLDLKNDLGLKLSPRSLERVSQGQSSSGYESHFDSSPDDPIYSGPSEDEKTPARYDYDVRADSPAMKAMHLSSKYDKKYRKYSKKSVASFSSSGQGTLSTIPEGKIDFTIPRPVWPREERRRPFTMYNKISNTSPITQSDTNNKCGLDQLNNVLNDSLLSDSLILLTSNYDRANSDSNSEIVDMSGRDILTELSEQLNEIVEGKCKTNPQQALKQLQDKISQRLDLLNRASDDDMRKLSEGIRNNERLVTVSRAFSNSSSGNSTSGSNRSWEHRSRTISDNEELYHPPSASSSSGFSDLTHTPPSAKASPVYAAREVESLYNNQDNIEHVYANATENPVQPLPELPVFVHDDLANVPNGLRNAMIYGTLCRNSRSGPGERLIQDNAKKPIAITPNLSQLELAHRNKPSLWEVYYGAEVNPSESRPKQRDTDVPYYPAGGRPEVDFTLDLPRAELLMRRMKSDKRWRCRCRVVTSFLGVLFFLLSVMAVSLILTRGKRMFGSMV